MPLRCPRCSGPLASERRGATDVDACAACGGAWFDRGEVESAIAAADPKRPAPAAGVEPELRYLRCPRCDAPMTRRNWERISGVVLDHCNAHGVWVDPHELERIVAFEASGGKKRRARKEADELRIDLERERARVATWARIEARMRRF